MDRIGPCFDGKLKWLRGVESLSEVMNSKDCPSGCCLALPSNATMILKVKPATDVLSTFGKDVIRNAGETGWYYHGGNLASNGFRYAIPANASHVLKVCPLTEEVSFIGSSFGTALRQKWFGGIIGSDGCIYGIPHNEAGGC